MLSTNLGELLFSLSGEVKAVAKQRPRSAGSGHFYTPKRTRDYERAIKDMAEAVVAQPPADCPVSLEVVIIEAPPKSWPEWKKWVALKGYISPNRGDLDNKVKAISDALNGVAYLDDVQVCQLTATMRYGSKSMVHVEVHRAGYTIDEARSMYEYAHRSGVGMGG